MFVTLVLAAPNQSGQASGAVRQRYEAGRSAGCTAVERRKANVMEITDTGARSKEMIELWKLIKSLR